MSTAPLPGDHAQGEPRTLGDLLYRDASGPSAAEAEWVRLVRAIAAGDQHALRALYDRSHRFVFTLMVRITGNRDTADELTVDVFHDVWRRAAKYEPASGSVLGWILNQARSRAVDRLRFDNRLKRAGDPAGAMPPAAAVAPADAAVRDDESRLLRTALDNLTPEERLAIETAFFGQLAYREVAEMLGQPLGTVKTRIRSGLAKLRQWFASRSDAP